VWLIYLVKMKCAELLFCLVCVVVAAYAGCTTHEVDVTNAAEFKNALENAQPGDNIVLAHGAFDLGSTKQFVLTNSGDSDCPIVISCAKPGDAIVMSTLNISGSNYVEVWNLTLRAKNVALYYNGGGYSVLDSLNVSSEKGYGMYLWSCDSMTVNNCIFGNTEKNALVLGSSYSSVISFCNFLDGIKQAAIDVNYAVRRAVINHCVFYGSGYTNAKAWMTVGSDSHDNKINYNFFYNPDNKKMQSGILCTGGSDNSFKHNIMILNEGAYGYSIGHTMQTVCANNVVEGGAELCDANVVLCKNDD